MLYIAVHIVSEYLLVGQLKPDLVSAALQKGQNNKHGAAAFVGLYLRRKDWRKSV